MGDEGLERRSSSPRKTAISHTGGAESGAVAAQNAGSAGRNPSAADPELTRLAEAWARLPEGIRRGILAMVVSALPSSDQTA
jgi:hypothetical protein